MQTNSHYSKHNGGKFPPFFIPISPARQILMHHKNEIQQYGNLGECQKALKRKSRYNAVFPLLIENTVF
jgi:hypothetical protein